MQSVYITTNAVSLNPAHGEVCLIQHYVIKFVNDLRPVSFTNKTDHHDITKTLLKVALSTINLTTYTTLNNMNICTGSNDNNKCSTISPREAEVNSWC